MEYPHPHCLWPNLTHVLGIPFSDYGCQPEERTPEGRSRGRLLRTVTPCATNLRETESPEPECRNSAGREDQGWLWW